MFTGEYRHTVDDKGRIAVPAKFRAQLDAGSVVSRWLDACLAIHTQAGWDELADQGRGAARSPTRRARRFQRFVFARRGRGRARPAGPGPAARPTCATASASAREAVVVGSRDHAEIWAPDRWDDYRQALDDPQALAEAFEGLGI